MQHSFLSFFSLVRVSCVQCTHLLKSYNDCWSKLWKAKFFILCDAIFLVRLQGNLNLITLGSERFYENPGLGYWRHVWRSEGPDNPYGEPCLSSVKTSLIEKRRTEPHHTEQLLLQFLHCLSLTCWCARWEPRTWSSCRCVPFPPWRLLWWWQVQANR